MSAWKIQCLVVALFMLSTVACDQSCPSGCPDQHYCNGPNVAVHVNMRCEDGQCVESRGTTQDCIDRYFCSGDNIMYVDGYCSSGFCVEDAAVVHADCSDYWYCSGNTAVLEHRSCQEGSSSCYYSDHMPPMQYCEDDGKICYDGACIYPTTTTTSTTLPCVQEGESAAVLPQMPDCCPGLTYVGCDLPATGGECEPCAGASYCANCGDGICGPGENTCRCPQDCG